MVDDAEKKAREEHKKEVEALKEISSLAQMQLEVDRIALKQGMSAKQKDALFQKAFNENLAGVKAMLSEGGNIANLTTGMQKTVIDSYRMMGEEVNEGDERRARQTQRDLMEIAFQVKKAGVGDALAAGDITETMANLQLAAMETGNFFQKSWLNFQDRLADGADIKNLGSAISQDFSMLTAEFQGIMALPGMKTISQGIKYIASWIGKWMLPYIITSGQWLKKNTWDKLFKAKDVPGADAMGAGPLKKDGTPDMRYAANKTKKDGLKGVADTKDTAGLTPKGKAPVPIAAATTGTAVAGAAGGAKLGSKGLMRRMNRTMRRMTRALKRVSKAINRLVKILLAIFIGPHMIALAKGAKTFITAVWGFIVKAMGALIAGFKKAALGLLKMAKRMMVVIGQFLAAAYAFIVGTLLPAIIAFLANPMTWIVIGIIALLVLIAVAWYFLITYMMENWEKVKVRMNMAADRLKLVGTKIANWFRDLGSDIGFIIKKMIAKIKDGFVYVVNGVIEGFARGIGSGGPVRRQAQKELRALKLTGGYSDKVDADRSTELARRDARDAKLEADFEAKYAERGKELEEAEIKDFERNLKKAGGDGTEINAPTITEIDQRQVYHTSESTEITDQVTQTAVAVVQ